MGRRWPIEDAQLGCQIPSQRAAVPSRANEEYSEQQVSIRRPKRSLDCGQARCRSQTLAMLWPADKRPVRPNRCSRARKIGSPARQPDRTGGNRSNLAPVQLNSFPLAAATTCCRRRAYWPRNIGSNPRSRPVANERNRSTRLIHYSLRWPSVYLRQPTFANSTLSASRAGDYLGPNRSAG